MAGLAVVCACEHPAFDPLAEAAATRADSLRADSLARLGFTIEVDTTWAGEIYMRW